MDVNSRRKCEDCGCDDVRLTRHHLTYTRGVFQEPIEGIEEPDELAHLCWPCHQARHRDRNGDYWRDTQEMGWHWESFYRELEKE